MSLENRHEVIQGIKDKSVKGIKYVLNDSLPEGYIYILGCKKMIELCGFDSDEIYQTEKKEKWK